MPADVMVRDAPVRPSLRDLLVKLRASPVKHLAKNLPFIPINRWRRSRTHPYLLVDITDKMGLGASLSLIVRSLAHAEKNGLTPVVRLSNPLYSPTGRADTDILPLLFERLRPDEGSRFDKGEYLRPYWQVERLMEDAHADISVQTSHDLLSGYMKIRADLVEEADRFCAANGIGPRTLAVHYRGTDKYLESPRVEQGRVISLIAEHAGAYDNIFVATDEPEFLASMRETFGDAAVRDLQCKWIYPNAQAAHLVPGNGPEKAWEALSTMVVLSRCALCIRTPSNLSHWAQVLNPDLPVILVGAPAR